MLRLTVFAFLVTCGISNAESFIYPKSIEEFKKTVVVDTVARVLNYSDGLSDEGSKYSTWYAYDAKKCIYRKAEYENAVKVSDDVWRIDLNENVRELRLNSFGRGTIRYRSENLKYGGFNPRQTTQVYIFADGSEIFRREGIDPERVSRGWSVIYSKYCSGAVKEF